MTTIALLGQSLIQAWTTATDAPPAPDPQTALWNGSDWAPVTGNGAIWFANCLRQLLQSPIKIYQAAVGGSALCPISANPDPNQHWLTGDTGRPYRLFLEQIWTSNVVPDFIIWNQGQQDYWQTPYWDYLSAIGQLQTNILSACGKTPETLPIMVMPSGPHVLTTHMAEVRRAQLDILRYPGFKPGPSQDDLATVDGTHLDAAGYAEMGRRAAACVAVAMQQKPMAEG